MHSGGFQIAADNEGKFTGQIRFGEIDEFLGNDWFDGIVQIDRFLKIAVCIDCEIEIELRSIGIVEGIFRSDNMDGTGGIGGDQAVA